MKITRFKEVKDKGSIVAYLDVHVEEWGLHINHCKLIEANGGRFVAFPAFVFEKEGEKCFAPYVKFDKNVCTRFQSAINKAIDEYRNSR